MQHFHNIGLWNAVFQQYCIVAPGLCYGGGCEWKAGRSESKKEASAADTQGDRESAGLGGEQ